jgi:hypothetical protein
MAMMKPMTENWSNLFQVDFAQLRSSLGFELPAILLNMDPSAKIGTKSVIFGSSDPTSGRLAATYERKASFLPAVLFSATRIVPLHNLVHKK